MRNLFIGFKMLPLIRLMMLLSVVVPVGFIWFLFNDTMPGVDEAFLGNLRLAFLTLVMIQALGVMFVRRKLEEDLPPDKIFWLLVVGWSFGEMVALFGAIIIIMGGDFTYYASGILVFLMTLFLLPIPKKDTSD